jgi:urease accessory protein
MVDVMNFMPTGASKTGAQRASGQLQLSFQRSLGTTRIDRFYQEGCLKARLPRRVAPAICDAVLMNLSGGIAGGDRLVTDIVLDSQTQACVSSQAAERIYRALDAPASITTRITLQPGAALHYLPQETILFDGFALHRSLEIALAQDAVFLGVEALVFGRQAMGEVLRAGHLRDQISLWRDGRLVLQDMTRLDGEIAAQLDRPAVASGARAMAALILAGPGAEQKLAPLREALAGAQAGVSVVAQTLFVRILAPDGASLRNCVQTALDICRDGRALPKLWQG